MITKQTLPFFSRIYLVKRPAQCFPLSNYIRYLHRCIHSTMRFVPGLFLLSGLIVRCFASDPEVTIQNGTIIGRSLPSFKQDIFLGIPYSEPPVRFHQSVPRSTPFNGSLVASYVNFFFNRKTCSRKLDADSY